MSLISRLRSDVPRSSTIAARARLFVSAIRTPAGQARVQMPQPEHRSTVRSGEAAWTDGPRKRCACGPTYFGPGKASVTRLTGQTVVHTLHLMQASVLNGGKSRAAASWNVMPRPSLADSARAARWALASATPSPQRCSR